MNKEEYNGILQILYLLKNNYLYSIIYVTTELLRV